MPGCSSRLDSITSLSLRAAEKDDRPVYILCVQRLRLPPSLWLTYYSIMNLMSRAEGQFTAEHVIKNSFHQFQYEKALPDTGKKASQLEEEVAVFDASGEAEVADYDRLKIEMAKLEKKMMVEITQPDEFYPSYYLAYILKKLEEVLDDEGAVDRIGRGRTLEIC